MSLHGDRASFVCLLEVNELTPALCLIYTFSPVVLAMIISKIKGITSGVYTLFFLSSLLERQPL